MIVYVLNSWLYGYKTVVSDFPKISRKIGDCVNSGSGYQALPHGPERMSGHYRQVSMVRRIPKHDVMAIEGSQLYSVCRVGLGGICWHDFGNNQYQKALSIMWE